MSEIVGEPDGATALDPDELEGLIFNLNSSAESAAAS